MARSKLRPATIRAFLDSEAAGGVVLMAVAVVAMAVANSPLSDIYFGALHQRIGGLDLLHWVNDGLMAVFFLLVGLEIKRELVDGELNSWSRRVLPAAAAAGGMAVPALVYGLVQGGDASTLHGWAIPAATDIAFALGVLSLLGRRVPTSLKIFLTALAILDDLGAVAIIALFYSHGVRPGMLAGAGLALAVLWAFNRKGLERLWPYLLVGAALWIFVLNSGIHATLAGVALAFAIPLKSRIGERTPLHRLEHGLKHWVAFGVLPVFGFANAGVSLAGLRPTDLLQPIPLGVALGLFVGKQAGVFAAAAVVIRLGWAKRPAGASWRQLYGVCVLCGVGFTMSLFIGLLAFRQPELQDAAKLGVLAGSLLSAVAGAVVLLAGRRAE